MRTKTSSLVTLLIAAAAVSGLALVATGTSLVVTRGTSMQPTYHEGDLVVIRAHRSYEVGDVAAFQMPQRGSALHRIMGGDGATGFVLKGDNNESIDPVRPTADELVGKAVLHLPGGGTWLRRLTSPPALAAYAFLLLVGGTAAGTRRERQKERREMSPRHRTAPLKTMAALPPHLSRVAAGAAAVGLTGLALSGVAWTRPTTTSVAADQSVTSTMDFSYTAQVPPSPAYDGTTVTAPQPVFRALTDTVDVTYRYDGVPGRLDLQAQLSMSSGWTSTVPLQDPVDIGVEHEGSVRLHLAELQQRAREAADVIGIPASSVTVAVVPRVALDGGGDFAPKLELALDELTLKPTGDLTATSESSTTGRRTVPAELSALGRSIDVSTARVVGFSAAFLAVLAGMAVAALARLAGPVSEAERIRRRHRDVVMTVLPMVFAKGRPIVDVPDVDSLVQLAERYGLPVLTWSRGGVDTYVVQDEGTTFRYRSGEPTGTTTATVLVQTQLDEVDLLQDR